jgi:predicted RNA methylase
MSTLSLALTRSLSAGVKKQHGIFFTPTRDVEYLIDMLDDIQFKTVLEPSCGSCEFVTGLERMPGLDIDCYEINEYICDEIRRIKFNNNVDIQCANFLSSEITKRYDLIIGNPPYTCHVDFLIKSLSLIAEDGHLMFILPTNFICNKTCNAIRTMIDRDFRIKRVHVFDQSKYLETSQDTCAIFLQKRAPSINEFVMKVHDRVVFNTKRTIEKMKECQVGSKTLTELGFRVTVGNVLWNMSKDILTDDPTFARLIYSSDIIDNKLTMQKYINCRKQNFIRKQGLDNKCLVVNRGYGSCKYDFRYAVIDHPNYLVENHLLVVTHDDEQMITRLYESLDDIRTKTFVKAYCRNNAMTTTELSSIVPIHMVLTAFRDPHSAIRIPRSAFRDPRSARRSA